MALLQRIVLLGTGTDVGKTYVAAQLCKAWRASMGPVLALKPIESGMNLENDAALPPESDAGTLEAAATTGAVPLYTFRDPISPHLAARRENRTIELAEISQWVLQKEAAFLESHGPALQEGSKCLSLVESAGGAFSPVTPTLTNVDLANTLAPSIVVLIAPDSVGVLHDVTATLRAMPLQAPDLVVLSGARPADATTGTNGPELMNIVFPFLGSLAPKNPRVCHVKRDGDAHELARVVRAMSAD